MLVAYKYIAELDAKTTACTRGLRHPTPRYSRTKSNTKTTRPAGRLKALRAEKSECLEKRSREAREVQKSTAAARHGPENIVAAAAAATDTPSPASPRTPTKQTHPNFGNDEDEDRYLGRNNTNSESEQVEKHGGDESRVSEEQGQAVEVEVEVEAEAGAWDKVRDRERYDEVLQDFLARHAAEEAYPALGKNLSEYMCPRRGYDAEGGDGRLAGPNIAAIGSEWGLKVLR